MKKEGNIISRIFWEYLPISPGNSPYWFQKVKWNLILYAFIQYQLHHIHLNSILRQIDENNNYCIKLILLSLFKKEVLHISTYLLSEFVLKGNEDIKLRKMFYCPRFQTTDFTP